MEDDEPMDKEAALEEKSAWRAARRLRRERDGRVCLTRNFPVRPQLASGSS